MNQSAKINQYIEAIVYVPESLADAVSSYVIDNVTGGVELKDSENSKLVGIKFYVSDSDNNDFRPGLKKYLSEIVNSDMPVIPEIKEQIVSANDWEESYRQSIKPVIIDNDICVRPPWSNTPSNIKFDIVIEPKMAFGTGHHETTSNCLKLIKKYLKPGQRFLDYGCGSGILSIMADKMKAGHIKAVDNDSEATANAQENFEINRVVNESEIVTGSFDDTQADEPYDLVCANLATPVIVAHIEDLKRLTKADGVLVLSGILDKEKSAIDSAITNMELQVVEFIHEGEWLTYCVKQ